MSDKVYVLNCCYKDGSIQKILEDRYYDEALQLLADKAAADDADVIVAKPGTGPIPEDFPAILAEPSALCNMLSGLPPMCSEERIVDGKNAEVFTMVDLLDVDRYGYLCIEGAPVKVDGNSTWRNLISDIDDVRFLAVGGLSPHIVMPDGFDANVDMDFFKDPLFDGIVRIVAKDSCPVVWLKNEAKRSKENACGKCVYCRLGSKQISVIAEAISDAESSADEIENIVYVADGMQDAAGCSYGRNFGRFVLAYMEYFKEEFAMHVRRRKCAALECPGYITFHVLPKDCNGCNLCNQVCACEAILGEAGEIHVIDKDACDKCGKCLDACPAKAVVKAGLIKPKTPKFPVPVGSWTR